MQDLHYPKGCVRCQGLAFRTVFLEILASPKGSLSFTSFAYSVFVFCPASKENFGGFSGFCHSKKQAGPGRFSHIHGMHLFKINIFACIFCYKLFAKQIEDYQIFVSMT